MEDAILNRALTVTTPEAAAALGDPFRRHLVLSFIGRERSVSEIAAAGGISVSLAHYHVRRLCELGLLEQSSFEPRRGRAIKKYTARTSAFYIPGPVREGISGASLEGQLRQAIDEARTYAEAGLLVYLDDRGAMRMKGLDSADRREIPLDAWHILDLEDSVAAELARELEDVLRRYEQRAPAARSRRYIVRCAIARRKDDELFETGRNAALPASDPRE